MLPRDYTNTIIISAVNLVEGGTFSILKKCVQELVKFNVGGKYRICVLVHSKDLLPEYENVEYIACPSAKKNWLLRMYYEYIHFFFLSCRLKPLVWISLHDMTPNVHAKYLYTYMHNPSPFFHKRRGMSLSLKFTLFVHFYKYIYRINVRRNTAVIVQQDWLRSRMAGLCGIPMERIIVAYPEFEAKDTSVYEGAYNKAQFFFNAYPREFKNFETICAATELLAETLRPDTKWDVYLTIDGTENAYSRRVVSKYKHICNLHFIGLLSREQCEDYYKSSECLIFPSLLETWGLPISEFKIYGKKMILADLPYAHEAATGAKAACFFNPTDAKELAKAMEAVIKEETVGIFHEVSELDIQEPFCKSWQSLFGRIIKE